LAECVLHQLRGKGPVGKSLDDIGMDRTVIRWLGGRSLMKWLQAHPEQFQVESEAPKSGSAERFKVRLCNELQEEEEDAKRAPAQTAEGEEAEAPQKQAEGRPWRGGRPHEELPILARGEGVVAVGKPAGITTEDVMHQLKRQLGLDISPYQMNVQRLDKGTSGVLMVGTTLEGAAAVSDQLRNRGAQCVVMGGIRASIRAPSRNVSAGHRHRSTPRGPGGGSRDWLAGCAGRIDRTVEKRYMCLVNDQPTSAKGEVQVKLLVSSTSSRLVQHKTVVSPHGKEAHTRWEVITLTPPAGVIARPTKCVEQLQ
ncbi:hypothetical protein CYMTET_35549, partial [Cymbomonas tetramitiformis]